MEEKFSEKDIELLDKCIKNPSRYSISVDNDSIRVWDNDTEDLYTFDSWGGDFIVYVLRHLGCTADWC